MYLLAVQPTDYPQRNMNGNAAWIGMHESGLRMLRTAEIMQLLDENGHMIRQPPVGRANNHGGRPRLSKLIVKLDAAAYKIDNAAKISGKADLYDTINVIVRRKGRENNFKRILETMQSLALSEVPLPPWLHEVFLGYGDPTGASNSRLKSRLKAVDFRDTFLDWDHLVESLPGKVGRWDHDLICDMIHTHILARQSSQILNKMQHLDLLTFLNHRLTHW